MASESVRVIARGQLSFIDVTIPNKDSIRSRWIEINGTDSVTQTSDKGSYYTIKTLVAKYANIAGNSVLTFNGQVLTFNGYVLTFPNIGSSELDTYYYILRDFLADAGLADPAEEFEHFDWDTYSEHLTNYEDAETRLNDLIYQALQRYSSETRENYENFRVAINATIEEMQDVLDNTIETWFGDNTPTLSNFPASDWSASEYPDHLGDLYYSNTSGDGYRFQYDSTNDVYFWKLLQDSAAVEALSLARLAKDTADGKRRVFLSQPGTDDVYDVGDLWVNATVSGIYDMEGDGRAKNDLLRARVAKQAGVIFNPIHWQKASKYTDDTKALDVEDHLHDFQDEITTTIDMWTDDDFISPQEKLALYNYFNTETGIYNELVSRYEDTYGAPSTLDNYYQSYDNAYGALERTIGYYVQPKITAEDYPASDTHVWSDTITLSNTYPLQQHIGNYVSAKEAFEAALNDYAYSDYKYLKEALGLDGGTYIQDGGLVLGNVIGVLDSDDNVVAAMNGDGSISGWSDATNGTLMFAAGISDVTTAATTAATRIFADGTIITNKLIATNAELSGEITSSEGTIGGWRIANNALYSNDDSIELDANANSIKIYNSDGELATQVDGAVFTYASNIINTQSTITIGPGSTSYVLARAVDTPSDVTLEYAPTVTSDGLISATMSDAGTLRISGINLSFYLDLAPVPVPSAFHGYYKVELLAVSDAGSQTLYASGKEYWYSASDGSCPYNSAKAQTLLTNRSFTINLPAGNFTIYPKITIWLQGNNSGNPQGHGQDGYSVSAVYGFTRTSNATVGSPSRMSRLFGNGIAISYDSLNYFIAMNAAIAGPGGQPTSNTELRLQARSGSAGITLLNNGLAFVLNGYSRIVYSNPKSSIGGIRLGSDSVVHSGGGTLSTTDMYRNKYILSNSTQTVSLPNIIDAEVEFYILNLNGTLTLKAPSISTIKTYYYDSGAGTAKTAGATIDSFYSLRYLIKVTYINNEGLHYCIVQLIR